MLKTKIKNFFLTLIQLLIFFILFFEIFSIFASKLNILAYNDTPHYSFKMKNGLNWLNEKEIWGAWHKKNYEDEHLKICSDNTVLFNVSYSSNNVGARDEKDYFKDNNKKNNSIFIGDSMVEGYGIHYEQTFKKILEDNTETNILNFSTSGNFGPAQYFLIYENLAKNFNHNKIVLFFTAMNDYRDNSISRIESYPGRYRPYIKKTNSSFEIVYPNNSKKRDDFILYSENKFYNMSIKFLVGFTFSANTIKTLKLIFSNKKEAVKNNIKNSKEVKINRGYFANNKRDIDGAFFFIEKLFKNVQEKEKYIVLIPDENDLRKINRNKNYKDYYWHLRLKNISKKLNINVIDLAPILKNFKNDEIFFKCDPHLSPNGNKIIANILLNKIFKK